MSVLDALPGEIHGAPGNSFSQHLNSLLCLLFHSQHLLLSFHFVFGVFWSGGVFFRLLYCAGEEIL